MKFLPNRVTEVRQIGSIGVDAGIIGIQDPCYGFAGKPTNKAWSAFCAKLDAAGIDVNAYANINGGVVLRITYGDGEYPVYALHNREGRQIGAVVLFDGEQWDEEKEDT